MAPRDFPTGYRPILSLGKGSMGDVWLAWSEQAGGHCAVKLLDQSKDRQGSAERSFNREVRALAQVDHPTIAQVLDFGRTPRGLPFLVMEYAQGKSLHAYMRRAWRWGTLWLLLDRLLTALGHVHARELVHRDLKPGNVMILPGALDLRAVRLVDFGIALPLSQVGQTQQRIEGTPAYMAPEAAAGELGALGPWTDLYALGVLLFELLTGELPFRGRHLLAHHQHSAVPELRLRPQVEAPDGLIAIVRRLLEKAPEDRYLSVSDVRRALAELGPAPAPVAFEPVEESRLLLDDDEPELPDEIVPATRPAGTALIQLRTPHLVGREQAKAQLAQVADQVLRGEGPHVVLVEGEAGLGKSSLVHWLRECLEENGLARVLKVSSEPQVRSVGLRDAILRTIGAPTAQPREVPALMGRVLRDQRNQDNALRVLWPREGTEGSEARIKKTAWLLKDLAGERPFLLIAEDVHWSPEGRLLQLIRRLAQPDGPTRMLMIATLRPTERSAVNSLRNALLMAANVTHIRLEPVPVALLAGALETLAPLPAGLALEASRSAQGNPLLALEAVRAHVSAQEDATAVPTDPGELVAQRIQQLGQTTSGQAIREMLMQATLLGRSFTLRHLAQLRALLRGKPAQPIDDQEMSLLDLLMGGAVNQGFAVELRGERWRFSHDLLRQAFRGFTKAQPSWPALNLAAAQLKTPEEGHTPSGVELEVISRHYWEGEAPVEALEYALEGVRTLHRTGHMGNALTFVRRVIDWDDQCQLLRPEQRCELRLLGSDAAEHAGHPIEAERHADAAVGLARRNYLSALASRAASRLGLLRIREQDFRNAEKWLLDGLRFAREGGEALAEAEAQLALARFYRYQGDLLSSRIACEQALSVAQAHDAQGALQLRARSALARLARLEGAVEHAAKLFEEIAADAQERGFGVLAIEAKLHRGLCAWTMQDAPMAAEAFEGVLEKARGNLFSLELFAALGAAWAFAAQGRFVDCEFVLMHAESLRFDVRLTDPEAVRLREALRALLTEAQRPDLLAHLDRLSATSMPTHTVSSEERTVGGSVHGHALLGEVHEG